MRDSMDPGDRSQSAAGQGASLRLRALFDEAVDLDVERRAAFLARVREREPEHWQRLSALLDADAALDTGADPEPELPSVLDALSEAIAGDAMEPGAVVGDYRIVKTLGMGGMGAVYLAQRDIDGAAQQVAVKFLHRQLCDEDTMRRFRLERSILARLEHPNIARLIGAGEDAQGRPYVVLEYIDGMPITAYCDRHRLDLETRLGLFRQACSAVEYAHARLIVHRDIKPGNVLVSTDGTLKLVDFGIAKPLLAESGDRHTGTGLRLFSLGSAAPEQLRGEAVTVACDVYGLGALLYELLCGNPPFAQGRDSYGETERRILELPPRLPSAVAKDGDVDAVSARRARNPRDLARRLTGDLDNIALTALAKRPEERYRSVLSLEEDLQRYATGQAVHARGGRRLYRAGKFLRRHRWGAIAAATALFALLAFTAALGRLALDLQRERDQARLGRELAEFQRNRAERVTGFLVKTFESADPTRTRGDQVTARELLERGVSGVEHELEGQPALQSPLLGALGEAFLGLGLYVQAESALRRAVVLSRQGGADERQVAALRAQVARALHAQGRFDAALALADKLLREPWTGEDGSDRGALLAIRATALQGLGRDTEAIEVMERVVASGRPSLASDADSRHAERLRLLAAMLIAGGDAERARGLLEEALQHLRAGQSGVSPAVADTLLSLAVVERHTGRPEAAEAHARQALDIAERIYGADHFLLARYLNTLGNALRAGGRPQEAARLYRRSPQLTEAASGALHPGTVMLRYNLALLLDQTPDGRDEAETLYRQSLDDGVVAFGEQHFNLQLVRLNLARSLLARERPGEALALLEDAVAALQARTEGTGQRLDEARLLLASAHAGLGQRIRARELLAVALPSAMRQEGLDPEILRDAQALADGIGLVASDEPERPRYRSDLQ